MQILWYHPQRLLLSRSGSRPRICILKKKNPQVSLVTSQVWKVSFRTHAQLPSGVSYLEDELIYYFLVL